MIPKKFHLFWSGNDLSYFRYLTVKTLRHHHPDWEINLSIAQESDTSVRWEAEEQDSQYEQLGNHIEQAKSLADNVNIYTDHADKSPNYQSDFYRWETILREGGFYIDMDAIILRSFEGLRKHKFIYTQYGGYFATGIVASEPGHPMTKRIVETIDLLYNPKDYNSIGPYMVEYVVKRKGFVGDGIFNSKYSFQPIQYSHQVNKLYDGTAIISPETYAIHWFAAHPFSQEFNKTYDENKMMTGSDTISKILRDMNSEEKVNTPT